MLCVLGGRPAFRELMVSTGTLGFVAFDVLWVRRLTGPVHLLTFPDPLSTYLVFSTRRAR
jgi:hypothetical protein